MRREKRPAGLAAKIASAILKHMKSGVQMKIMRYWTLALPKFVIPNRREHHNHHHVLRKDMLTKHDGVILIHAPSGQNGKSWSVMRIWMLCWQLEGPIIVNWVSSEKGAIPRGVT